MPIFAFVFSPAAKVLVQIKGCSAVTQLHIREPLCDYVEKGCIQANSSPYKSDDNPGLPCIIGVSKFPPPAKGSFSFKETCILSSPRSPSQLLSRRVLDPIDRSEIFISFDFLNFLCKVVFRAACRSSILTLFNARKSGEPP